MISSMCLPECVPMIESVLAAHGNHVAVPVKTDRDGATSILMTSGRPTAVLITATRTLAKVDIWGIAQGATAQLLEVLPITWSCWSGTYVANGPSEWMTADDRADPDRLTTRKRQAVDRTGSLA